MEVDRLRALLKKTVRLTFRDGEVVDALLLGVDSERNRDLTYEVARVIHPASIATKATQVDTTYIAPLDELQSWSEI